jgi:PAS domain S-box-containing protein
MFGYASMEECRRKLADFADTFEVRPLDEDCPLPVADWPMSRVMRGEVLRDWEVRLRRLDQGWEKIFAYSGWFIRSASGEMLVFISVADVTNRKQAEETLRESEEKYRSLFENLNSAAVLIEPIFNGDGRLVDLRYLMANPSVKKHLGRTADELAGKLYSQVFPYPERNPVFDIYERVLSSGEPFKGEVLFPATGKYFDATVYRPIAGRLALVLSDITERKRAEEALRESQRLLQDVIDGSPSPIFLKDRDWKFITINTPLEKMLGIMRDELRGKTDYDIATKEMADYWRFHDEQVMRTGKPLQIEEVADLKDDHHVFLANKFPLVDGSGQIYGVGAISHDITAQRRTEDALHESEERFRTMANAIPQLAWIAKSDGYIFWYNQRWYDYTGTTPEEMEGWGWQRVHDPEVLPQVLEQWKASIATGDPFDMVFPLLGADSQFRPFLTRVMPLKDASGKVIQWFGTNTDVTERKRMEEELRRSRDELEIRVQERTEAIRRQADLIELSHEPIIVKDLESRILFWSRGAEEAYGWTKAEAEGNIIHSFLKTQFPVPFDEHMAALTGVGHWKGELVHTRKDGSELTVLSRQVLQRDEAGTPIDIMEINIDITERKQAEKALSLASAYNRRLIEASIDPLVTINPEGRISDVNAATEQATGYSRDELIGTDFSDYFTDPQKARAGYQMVFKEGLVRDYPLEIRHRNGHITTVLYNASVYRDDTGSVIGVFAAARDVSEQQKLEVQLRQAQKMEALGTMSGGIAHDFNNILAAIIGFAELLEGHIAKESRDAHHLGRIVEAGIRGRELVRQMLAFSRKAEQEKKPLAMNSIVKESVKLLRATTPTTISIRVNALSEALILADPTQMQQVLMNLCTNAAYAMREKGGSLQIELSDYTVSASNGDPHGIDPGQYVRLSVRDTGTGIPADIMDKIFDPFFTTKKLGEGTGLGLSVVHGIVKQHDGYITVESEPGKGSTFTVYFPQIMGGAEADGVHDDEIPTGSERILFVDDEEALVEMGEDILAELGYEVTSRMNGREALKLLRLDPSRFDLVITDQTMPEMTGVELAKEVLALRPGMPIIMCTGFSYVVNEDKAKAAGIKAFAMKPLTKREIARTIRRVLDE